MSDKKGAVCCVSNSKFDRMFMWGNVVRGSAVYYKFLTPLTSPKYCKAVKGVAAYKHGDFLYIKLLGKSLEVKTKEFGTFEVMSTYCIRVDMTDSFSSVCTSFTENESLYQLKDFV